MDVKEDGTTFFTFSFCNQFAKEAQCFGPLSVRGSIVLQTQGEITDKLQEDIEGSLNQTLQDLYYRYKLCFSYVCAKILTPEEMRIKEKLIVA